MMWYKAAYYDPTNSVYYDYPTGSNSTPTNVGSGTAAGTAVYHLPESTGPADITLAGGLSPYGTMAQGGNVYEWQETNFNLVNDNPLSYRSVRGGGWRNLNDTLKSQSRPSQSSGFDTLIGFRVASVPEPSSLLLAVLSIGLTWPMLKRRWPTGS